MDLVLCGLTYVTCLVYLGDIIVFARDFSTHLSRLAEVFERLKQAGLKLHGTKCSLFQRRVSFLGHVLSGEGIAYHCEFIHDCLSFEVDVVELLTSPGQWAS